MVQFIVFPIRRSTICVLNQYSLYELYVILCGVVFVIIHRLLFLLINNGLKLCSPVQFLRHINKQLCVLFTIVYAFVFALLRRQRCSCVLEIVGRSAAAVRIVVSDSHPTLRNTPEAVASFTNIFHQEIFYVPMCIMLFRWLFSVLGRKASKKVKEKYRKSKDKVCLGSIMKKGRKTNL